mgnify:CR=1 FL=1|tara:strand:+ start:870 stop:1580 length:711 start_codon:yes stop_codon:yes gene_type:complete
MARFDARQLEIWKMQTEYCYVMRYMFDDGIAANLEANDFRVLVYIKMCASFQDGYSFPAYQTIADKCGIKRKTAMTCVKRLVEQGLLVKEKRGTTYGYRVVEKLTAHSTAEEEKTALLEHYYIPNQVKKRQQEYKQFARTGKNPNPAEIKVTINVSIQNNIVTGNKDSTINIAPQVNNMDALAEIANNPDIPVGTREQALNILRMTNEPSFQNEITEKLSGLLIRSLKEGSDDDVQ